MRKNLLALVCSFLFLSASAQLPKDFVIPVKISVSASSIRISWEANADATSYYIKRKIVKDSSYKAAFTPLIDITSDAALATNYIDFNVVKGVQYEYEISANYASTQPLKRSTYVCAGIDILPVHSRGSIILLCESSIVTPLQNEINRLFEDLVGDGWNVIPLNVPRSENTAAVVDVKNKILNVYQNNPDLKQVFILGHVPVPYSGDLSPDGHTNHQGCWPADGYYGDMTTNWTDTFTGFPVPSTRPENINRPGDGKFDQSELTAVQLGVGRVDFAKLTSFNLLEEELLRRYLNKNHLFRTAETQINRQALVEENFPAFTEKFSQSAWKSYAAIVGYDNVFNGQYETDLQASIGYLWSYGNGAGIYTGASGICSTSDFVSSTYKTVFTQLFGSYFGDWDSPDNFMRASLASAGNTLTCVWGGRPHWYFHHMSAGMPIGYSALLTMNNNGNYSNPGNEYAMVHIALMGDPTLRSSYVKPARSLVIAADTVNYRIKLRWTKPAETNIAGYYVYRNNSINGRFTLLNSTPVTDTSFTDYAPVNGNNVYMIRTLKVDSILTSGNYTNNSTYNNLAKGIFDSVYFYHSTVTPSIFLSPIPHLMGAIQPKQVVIRGTSNKRYYVGEKNGDVMLFDSALNLAATYLTQPGINEGFFSMAFDPQFEFNKYLYVFYTNMNGDLELSRYQEINDSTAKRDAVMLNISNPGNSRNLGGELHFDADGYLYISTGDGDSKDATLGNAQNARSMLGKILRIFPDGSSTAPYYTIPADNPFGNEVFASGLRFPYRWDFDRLTKDVWIGDRGDSSIEEVNHITFERLNGANFGWPCYEGLNTFNNNGCGPASEYYFPQNGYPSPGSGSSITGGTVYRGETFIALRGYYVFADLNNNKIYFSKYDSTTQTYTTTGNELAPGAISDISEDSSGELYATSLNGGVYRIGSDGPRAYRFTGEGNWENPDNWTNKTIPPSVLPPGSEIIISPANNSTCILNRNQIVSPGAKIIVEQNRHFRVAGNLIMQ